MSLTPDAFETEETSPQAVTALFEVASAVVGSLDFRQGLIDVLDILVGRLGVIRPMITILSPDGDEVQVEAAQGLSSEAVRRGRYKRGEGVTGRVLESGEPMVVPQHLRRTPLSGPNPKPPSGGHPNHFLYLRPDQIRTPSHRHPGRGPGLYRRKKS